MISVQGINRKSAEQETVYTLVPYFFNKVVALRPSIRQQANFSWFTMFEIAHVHIFTKAHRANSNTQYKKKLFFSFSV